MMKITRVSLKSKLDELILLFHCWMNWSYCWWWK